MSTDNDDWSGRPAEGTIGKMVQNTHDKLANNTRMKVHRTVVDITNDCGYDIEQYLKTRK